MAGPVLQWAAAEPVPVEKDIHEFTQEVADLRSQKSLENMVQLLAYLFTDLLGRTNRHLEGLAVLNEAFERGEREGVHWYQAELLRRKGELMLHQVNLQTEAEEYFQQALKVAQHQGARSLELRAAKGLWNEELEAKWKAEAEKTLNQAVQEAEAGPLPQPEEMFLYTFADLPPQLKEQMEDYLNFLKEKEG